MATICYSCAALVLLAVLCVPSVYSYSAGAREESCYNMQAIHFDTILVRNASSQDCFAFGPGLCPFSVEVVDKVDFGSGSGDGGTTESITTYECDQIYEVLVTTTTDRVFEGYMLEARATTASGDFEETSTIWGEWQAEPSDPYHTVNCSRNKDSTEIVVGAAATQNEGTQILNVTLFWKAPPQPENDDDYQNLPESITLWVTIVQAELAYFFPISAPDLERNCTVPPLPSSSPMPTMSPTSSLPASLPSVSFPPISLPPTSLPPTPLPSMTPGGGDDDEGDDDEGDNATIIIGAAVGGSIFVIVIIIIIILVLVCFCVCCVAKSSDTKDYYEPKSQIKLTTPGLNKESYELSTSPQGEPQPAAEGEAKIKRASGHYTAETFGVS